MFISVSVYFFFNDTATTEIYTYLHTLSLHDALPIYQIGKPQANRPYLDQHLTGTRNGFLHFLQPKDIQRFAEPFSLPCQHLATRSEEHTSELQSLMRISYAVFCLKKKKNYNSKTLILKSSTNQLP